MSLLIFDLDGTLVDSKTDIAEATNATRKLMGLPPLSLEIVATLVGHGAPVLVEKALGPGRSHIHKMEGADVPRCHATINDEIRANFVIVKAAHI